MRTWIFDSGISHCDRHGKTLKEVANEGSWGTGKCLNHHVSVPENIIDIQEIYSKNR